jgi:hypothetical protein
MTDSRPVCPCVRRISGTCDQFFCLLEISFRQLQLCYFVARWDSKIWPWVLWDFNLRVTTLGRPRSNCVEVEANLRLTDGQSANLSWCQAPLWDPWPIFLSPWNFLQTFAALYFVAPFLTKGRVCNLLVQLLLGLARAVTLESKSRRTHGHILLSHLILPQPEGPDSLIYILHEQGGPVIPLALVPFLSPLTTCRDYSRGILARLHSGKQWCHINYSYMNTYMNTLSQRQVTGKCVLKLRKHAQV